MAGLLTALAALVGTLLQMATSLSELRNHADAPAFRAIDELKTEVRKRSLRRWTQHRRVVRDLLKSSPEEWAAYRRLWAVLVGWTLLVVAAMTATYAAIFDLLT